MNKKTRIVIIGAGTAGLTAVSEVKRHTDDFVLINDGPYGTTCARVGCMPSKVLLSASHTYARRSYLKSAGISGTEHLKADIPAVMQHVRKLRDRFASGPVKTVEKLGDKSISGAPRFIDPNTIEVNGMRIETEKTIIATGTRPIIPGPWREFGDRIITTDSFFEMNDFGTTVAVIGLGPVGAELGQALAGLGLDVHGFSMDPTVAGLTDPEINSAMISFLEKDMSLYPGEPAEINETSAGKLKISSGGKTVEADKIIASLGRSPNIEGLGLENLGVELQKNGMPVFNPVSLQIADLPVFIAGDVSGLRPIMHEASDEGRIAAYNALTHNAECLERRTPIGIVFTSPNAARAGLSYASLTDKNFVTGKADFKTQGRAMTEGRAEGIIHIYADPADGKILGAEMAVPDGEHLAHILALAIQYDATLDSMLKMPSYHPTTEEGMRSALQDARKQINKDWAPGDLPLCL